MKNCTYVKVKNPCDCEETEGPFDTHVDAGLNVNVQNGSWYYLAVVNGEWTYSAGAIGPLYTLRPQI